jgi:hypothetical protein
VGRGDLALAETLVNHGGRVDQYVDARRRTLLHIAVEHAMFMMDSITGDILRICLASSEKAEQSLSII